MIIWGIHMGEHVGTLPVDKGYVGIGWPKLGDLTELAVSREKIKQAISEKIPDTKEGAIPVNAGVLFRFVSEIKLGDIIVYPSKVDRMVNIGRVAGDYEYIQNDPHGYPNHREIEWHVSLPRTEFQQSALNEIGSFITLFKIERHSEDFLVAASLLEKSEKISGEADDEADDDTITSSVSVQAEQTTDDFLIKQITARLDAFEFEHFVAHILECMGYTARVSAKSGDGGVDIVAHRDELGFEPPIIKVQCKQSTSQNSEPDVSQLLGTLGDGEYALFVNLGSYSRPARVLERNKSKLRLIDGEELVNLILEHYEKLAPKYRTIFPLKQIYVPDLN